MPAQTAVALAIVPVCVAEQVSATVRADSVPALPGVAEVLAAGITSSLHPANLAAADGAVLHIHRAQTHPQWHLLLDPQTGGAQKPPA